LAVSFTAVIGRSANIDVKIFDRSPIYVVGPVKNPGAYKYAPGMIVLHAIALAGGLDRGEGNYRAWSRALGKWSGYEACPSRSNNCSPVVRG
jgi:hypothetical protein